MINVEIYMAFVSLLVYRLLCTAYCERLSKCLGFCDNTQALWPVLTNQWIEASALN